MRASRRARASISGKLLRAWMNVGPSSALLDHGGKLGEKPEAFSLSASDYRTENSARALGPLGRIGRSAAPKMATFRDERWEAACSGLRIRDSSSLDPLQRSIVDTASLTSSSTRPPTLLVKQSAFALYSPAKGDLDTCRISLCTMAGVTSEAASPIGIANVSSRSVRDARLSPKQRLTASLRVASQPEVRASSARGVWSLESALT